MPKLICSIGVIGGGKDYQAKKLVQEGFKQINFADPLRELSWDILEFKPNDYESFKSNRVVNVANNFWKNKILTGRQFLQNLGNAMRKRDPNYWVNQWQNQTISALLYGQNVCCSDLRYPNELKAALDFKISEFKCDVEFIFCNYKSNRYEPNNKHESEKLAQMILADGFQDGDILPLEYLKGIAYGS